MSLPLHRAYLVAIRECEAGTAAASSNHGGHGQRARQFDLQAHRGGLGLVVESTLAAFANALEIGVSTLELDVQITQDGKAVITHDRKGDGNKCLTPRRPRREIRSSPTSASSSTP